MRVRIRIILEDDQGIVQGDDEVARLDRSGLSTATLGLTLAEAKSLLEQVQRRMTAQQTEACLEAARPCPHCNRQRPLKGHNALAVRTLFGTLSLPSPRLYRCACEGSGRSSFSPLASALPERTTPELCYLQTKWAGLMSYGQTVGLLSEVLPLDRRLNTRSLRRRLHQVAERLEADLGPERGLWEDRAPDAPGTWPRPELPLTVGIDGGFVHAREGSNRKAGWFEVIAGKSIPAAGASKCFAFVQRHDDKPRRRLHAILVAQGLAPNQQITFISDGGESVRGVQRDLHREAEHLLDWFHVTMRITVMRQMAKSLTRDGVADIAAEVDRALERVKWFLWHGNVYKAGETLDDLGFEIDSADDTPAAARLAQAVAEFEGYIRGNQDSVPNYGDRWRNGERISSGFAESTINQVVSKRMVKSQQMRWTPRGAHQLLRIRTKVLDGDLRAAFQRWYPDMAAAA